MGFRFHKRIKLGENLGINVSKSGLSASIRTKAGFISNKGFSARSGIPGLTYRKSFSKKSNNGCVVVLFYMAIGISTVYITTKLL
ncbi:DUF4236 domain-containing protein [uncultured Salegentibacter sp.]|uniref:DUF4236 domain-containing protein n=1 Tax=uncultured Salegentibacter sp. TaxID=259320 RepID=UPI00338E445E